MVVIRIEDPPSKQKEGKTIPKLMFTWVAFPLQLQDFQVLMV